MKKDIELNGDLKDALLKGSTIIKCLVGDYLNSILVENPKGSEWKFTLYESLFGDPNRKMLTATHFNQTKKQCIDDMTKYHQHTEILYSEKEKREKLQ